ncbi:hypothetical protein ABPG75_008771 [Micractinium tetrahymenae]
MPLPRPSSRGPSRQQLQPPPPQARQPRQAAQQQRTGSGGSAAAPGIAAGGPGSRAAPVVLAPPPGTRQRKQSKRESRLKRAFRRSQAVLACECWQSILGELEAALQGVSEAQGCLANQQASLAQQLAAAAGADAAAIDWASPQVALRQQDERQLARANLAVLQQLLEQQQRHAVECRARLERAHEHARIQLASAQQQLQKHERLPAPEPAPACAAAGADGGSAGAEGVVGAFRCLLCLVTVSGQRNLQEHLASKRHVRRVASQAAAAAQAAAGPEAAQALALAGTAGPAGPAADGSGRSSGGGAAGGGGRTYTGLGADVEPYVNQVITPELNALAEALLRRLLVWQERARLADPLNFKRKRRLVSGMREVEKAIKTRKAKLVLLAPNIASIVADPAAPEAAGGAGSQEAGTGSASGSGTGGAAAAECPAEALIALAAEKEVPLVFALSRQRMGKVMGQRKRASAFAVLDANGVFEELRRLLALAEEGRQAWAAAAAAARPAGAAAMNVGALP